MKVKCNTGTRQERTTYRTKLTCCFLLLACVRFSTYRSMTHAFIGKAINFVAPREYLNNGIDRTTYIIHRCETILKSKGRLDDNDDELDTDEETPTNGQRRLSRVRNRVADLARKMVQVPIHVASSISPMPQAVAAVLKDATINAVDLAVEEVILYRNRKNRPPMINGVPVLDVSALIEEAFLPVEASLDQMEKQLLQARISLREAKQHAITAMEAVEVAAIAQAEGAIQAVKAAEEAAGRKVIEDIYDAARQDEDDDDISSTMITSTEPRQIYTYENIDYSTSEMEAPFIGEDQCLVTGEPVARVEKAPENSRRIFAGIDIPHSVNDVWALLTDYPNLQTVVPNLVVNDVLEEYSIDTSGGATVPVVDSSTAEEVQCQSLANQMKGAKLRQIGGAKVAGIQFSARTTLEVREWPDGLPDFAHFNDEYWDGKSRKERMIQYSRTPLTRYMFPRPFALSKLPTRDISMQSIERDDGEFRMYQGVWRMQPLPGCAPPGKDAMRLTYAVEVSPRAYLPVALIEKRIVSDLCTNLVAIRDYLAKKSEQDIETLNDTTSS